MRARSIGNSVGNHNIPNHATDMLCHPPGDDRGLHNPKYDFHDANLVIGAAFWRRLVETYLRAT